MFKRTLLVFAALVAVNAAQLTAQDAKIVDGREYRIIQTNGKEIVGKVTELPNDYKITVGAGITVKIPKNRVYKIVEVKTAGNRPPGGTNAFRRMITDEEIEEVLGSEHVELGPSDIDEEYDLRAPLPVDEVSVREMERIAGVKAKRLYTDHFVLVYTSSLEKARKLASRLESVYEWNVKFMEMLDIPRTTRPDAKLEIFFFGTHPEYDAYQRFNGWSAFGAIGFYMRTNNRSAFFDMETFPPYKAQLEQARNPNVPPQERRRIKNMVLRTIEHDNLEVVQHEAAHHIHFNIGIFPRGGDLPTWMTEGLATMFEAPPSEVGASLGAVNHYRLFHFRRFYGDHGQNLPPLKLFILNDGMWNGFPSYSIGWALNHYLFRNFREEYGEWMRLLAKRPDDFVTRIETSKKQEQFEDIFGEVDDDWIKAFNDYIASIQLNRAALPPDFP
ncbi:MAG: DUF1570 domain-containing protein [Planctomycetota bacterium]|nr:MAG: DUF1570 domain-containing protein [Planctomycetota bacterium]